MSKELPRNWVELTIGELTEVVSGGTPSTTKQEYFDGEIPWITPADLSGYKEKYISVGKRNISELGLRHSSARLLPAGTVLFSSRAPIGYVAIAKNEFCTNQGFKNLLPNEAFDSSYAYYYLRHLKEHAESQASGTTFKELSGKKMAELPFLLPPLAEQKRIVAKLDAGFAHLDTLKAKLDRIPELLKSFRQAVLTQAITGKLSEEWRRLNKVISSEDVISQLKSKYKQNAVEEGKQLDTDSSPFEVPKAWKFAYLGELSSKLTYGTSSKSDNSGLVPVIRMGNLQGGKIDWTDLKYTSDQQEIEKYALKEGDVLFNRTNSPELVGKTSIYESGEPAIYAGYLIKIWNYSELNSYYLNYVLNSPYGRAWSWSVKTDGVSQSNINAQKLSKLLIPFPSPREQEEIIERVQELMTVIDNIELRYETLKEQIDKLPKLILNKAFTGRLVPQNDADEPASILLEKISKAKAENMTNNKPIRKKQREVGSQLNVGSDKTILDVVKAEFGSTEFTFQDLRSKTSKGYAELKEELFFILDHEDTLEMKFDSNAEVMKFKLLR